MNLSNEMRRELAVKLAVKAMEKHGAALGRLARKLKDTYRVRHLAKVKAVNPNITPETWAELIRAGLVAGASSAEVQRPDAKPGTWTTQYPPTSSAAPNLVFGTTAPSRQRLFCTLFSELNQNSGFSALFSLFQRYGFTRDHLVSPACLLPAQPDLPGHHHWARLDPDDAGDNQLLKDVRAISTRMMKVLSEGFKFCEDSLDLLNACRTVKQLEDLFPEAAKLLPPPAPKRANIVPVEAAQRLRKMLETGVPED